MISHILEHVALKNQYTQCALSCDDNFFFCALFTTTTLGWLSRQDCNWFRRPTAHLVLTWESINAIPLPSWTSSALRIWLTELQIPRSRGRSCHQQWRTVFRAPSVSCWTTSGDDTVGRVSSHFRAAPRVLDFVKHREGHFESVGTGRCRADRHESACRPRLSCHREIAAHQWRLDPNLAVFTAFDESLVAPVR